MHVSVNSQTREDGLMLSRSFWILDAGTEVLSNAEVLAHLNELEATWIRDRRLRKVPGNVQKVVRGVQEHLRTPPQATHAESPALGTGIPPPATFSPAVFAALAARLKARPFRLLPAEILQIFNHAPRNRAELVMIVEEGEDRFGDEALDRLLCVIEEALVRGRDGEEVVQRVNGTGGSR